MIFLKEYNLNEEKEWMAYLKIFREYMVELYSEDDDFQDILNQISSEEYHAHILEVTNRKEDTFHIGRIYKEDIFMGFCDYICYCKENGKCLIGNFYLYPEYRNHGYGTEVYQLIEKELLRMGGKYIDLTPEPKAVSFYARKGFSEMEDISLENGQITWRKVIA